MSLFIVNVFKKVMLLWKKVVKYDKTRKPAITASTYLPKTLRYFSKCFYEPDKVITVISGGFKNRYGS